MGAKSESDPTLAAVGAMIMAAVGEASRTWSFPPVQEALTPRKFSTTSSLSCLPVGPPVMSSLPSQTS